MTYYIQVEKSGRIQTAPLGYVDGTVIQLGWKPGYILVERRADTGPNSGGWLLLDATTGDVAGPGSQSEMMALSGAAGITVMPAASAWAVL